MNQFERFVYGIKYIIHAGTAKVGLDPDTIAKRILLTLTKEKNSCNAEEQFHRFILERQINQLVHFTPIDNVRNILRFGLIPRRYLQEESIRVAVNPLFSDPWRRDGALEANCLSISFPNYRMFYNKSKGCEDKWAVLLLDPAILIRHSCKFSHRNNASRHVYAGAGIGAARRLFSNLAVRRRNAIPSNYTTHPEAEVLEESVVNPQWVHKVLLYSPRYFDKVSKWAGPAGAAVEVDRAFFGPRCDWQYWQGSRHFDAENDYLAVLQHESRTQTGGCDGS